MIPLIVLDKTEISEIGLKLRRFSKSLPFLGVGMTLINPNPVVVHSLIHVR